MKIGLIRSGTWMDDNYDDIHKVLDETVEEFVGKNVRIINIETKTKNGLSRFWIYVEEPDT